MSVEAGEVGKLLNEDLTIVLSGLKAAVKTVPEGSPAWEMLLFATFAAERCAVSARALLTTIGAPPQIPKKPHEQTDDGETQSQS